MRSASPGRGAGGGRGQQQQQQYISPGGRQVRERMQDTQRSAHLCHTAGQSPTPGSADDDVAGCITCCVSCRAEEGAVRQEAGSRTQVIGGWQQQQRQQLC